jgi:hypothetical protein
MRIEVAVTTSSGISLYRPPRDEGKRYLPILVEKCEVRGFISIRKYEGTRNPFREWRKNIPVHLCNEKLTAA